MRTASQPPVEREETVAFVWPYNGTCAGPMTAEPYRYHFEFDRDWFERVQMDSGWQVTDEQWSRLSNHAMPGSMVFATKQDQPVAVATALSRDGGWWELAWVAVATEHRGHRLAKSLSTILVRKLLASNELQIFGSTQDERIVALRTYLEIGFEPVYREEKVQRWRAICDALDWPFTPQLWQWPDR